MSCQGCQYLGDQCGGMEGDPAVSTFDARAMTPRQMLELACVIARVGSVICDLGKVGSESQSHAPLEEPYIWDLKE